MAFSSEYICPADSRSGAVVFIKRMDGLFPLFSVSVDGGSLLNTVLQSVREVFLVRLSLEPLFSFLLRVIRILPLLLPHF